MEPDLQNYKISDKDRQMLEDAYYKDGMCFGRDGLFHHLTKKHGAKAPSRRTIAAWLSRQKLQQEYQGTRNSSGLTDYFRPVAPFHSISADLMDFNNKPAMQFRYILNVIDNFSRKVYLEALTAKKAVTTAKGMEKILERIKQDNGGEMPKIRFIIVDDGGEFKGQYDNQFAELMKQYNIEKRRTLGGNPQQNGLCERSNGTIKRLIAKNKAIHGGSWYDNLRRSENAYNNHLNRSTQYTANEALDLSETAQKTLINNVNDKHKLESDYKLNTSKYKVGDKVRIKLNKGTLGKSSTPSWSSTIYTVGKVIKSKLETIADKYKIKELDQDQNYSRTDLQQVIGTPEAIPIKPKHKKDVERLPLTLGAFTENALETAKNNKKDVRRKLFDDDDELDTIPEGKPKRKTKQTKTFSFLDEGLNDTQRKKLANAKKLVTEVAKSTSKRTGRKITAPKKFNFLDEGLNDTQRRKLKS